MSHRALKPRPEDDSDIAAWSWLAATNSSTSAFATRPPRIAHAKQW